MEINITSFCKKKNSTQEPIDTDQIHSNRYSSKGDFIIVAFRV